VNISLLFKKVYVLKVALYYFAQKEQFYYNEVMRIFRIVTRIQQTLKVCGPLSPLMAVKPPQRIQTCTTDSPPLDLEISNIFTPTRFYASTETCFGLNLSHFESIKIINSRFDSLTRKNPWVYHYD
jgi:hypothetical protein